jgi:BirA family biotin operon repressor/biotin-[acetyl-CoA-carboxylase] ligase
LYLSFLLRPRVPQALWPALTSLVSLALAEALESQPATPPGWRARIKWPNDVHGDRGKLAGVLAEVVGSGEGAVIGLGLNLTQAPEDFPAELRDRASSLRLERFSPAPAAEDVARDFNESLSRLYAHFHTEDRLFLRDGLLGRFLLRGSRVRADVGGRIVEGVAVDLGPLGELVVETRGGTTSLVSGEILSFEPRLRRSGPGRI